MQLFMKKIRGYFFTGLLVLIPILLSVYIIYHLFVFMDGLLRGFLGWLVADKIRMTIYPGFGLVALILIVVGTGVIARNYLGKQLLSLGNKIVSRIPVMNWIYGTIQQVAEALLSERSEVFKKAIMVEYPRKNIYSIGFITQDTKGVIQDSLDVDVVSVFLPTTPNPTSGFLLFVPKKDTRELDISVEEALKLVISGGAIVPRGRGKGVKVAANDLCTAEDTPIDVRKVKDEGDVPAATNSSQ